MRKGRREGRTEPNGCDGCRASPRPVEPHSWKAVCYKSSLHGLGRGSWKRAEVERVGSSQSVTTFEKRSSESIGEATRWLPTSFIYAFPQTMYRHIQTTNAIESLFSNVRQRTDQIDVFTTETSCLTIVWATIQDIRLHKISL
jgi:Transposase, Mutator family